jgi:hypothetical protein
MTQASKFHQTKRTIRESGNLPSHSAEEDYDIDNQDKTRGRKRNFKRIREEQKGKALKIKELEKKYPMNIDQSS